MFKNAFNNGKTWSLQHIHSLLLFMRGTKGNIWPLWQIVGEFLSAAQGSANSVLATHLLRSVIYPKRFFFRYPYYKQIDILQKILCHLFVAIVNLYLAWPAKEFPARDSNNGHDFSSLFL